MKQFNRYQVKGCAEIKDVDSKTRRVKIMLSRFDNIDSDGDIIRKGAFAKSIAERGPESTTNRKIQFLRYHDWEHQIGKFISLEETNDGLVAVGDLGTSSKGEDALRDYQDGIIKEHSIGFNYIEDKMQLIEQGAGSFWEIKEVALWEGSAVTFGSNELTPTLDVSKGNKQDLIDRLNEKMTLYIKTIRNGQGTDERFYRLEKGLEVLQQQYNDLIKGTEPSKKDTEPPKPDQQIKSFYLNLLSK